MERTVKSKGYPLQLTQLPYAGSHTECPKRMRLTTLTILTAFYSHPHPLITLRPFLIGVPSQRSLPASKGNKRIVRNVLLSARPLTRRVESRSPGQGLPGLVAGVERPLDVWTMRYSLFDSPISNHVLLVKNPNWVIDGDLKNDVSQQIDG